MGSRFLLPVGALLTLMIVPLVSACWLKSDAAEVKSFIPTPNVRHVTRN